MILLRSNLYILNKCIRELKFRKFMCIPNSRLYRNKDCICKVKSKSEGGLTTISWKKDKKCKECNCGKNDIR
jgi:hypothetical protein